MSKTDWAGRPSLVEAALAYARHGYAVFPLYPRSKKPLTANGFKAATADETHIRRIWAEHPNANIGIATGMMSRLAVIDFDVKHGFDPRKCFEQTYGPLPLTVSVTTGSGGQHFYFRIARPISTRHGTAGLMKNVDFQADGAYIVAPGSIHPNGIKYEFDLNCGLNDVPIALLPTNIEAHIRKNSRLTFGPSQPDDPNTRLHAGWRQLVATGFAEGERNVRFARLSGHLLRKGVDPYVVNELLQSWNLTHVRPPLKSDELQRIVESISLREASRRRAGGEA